MIELRRTGARRPLAASGWILAADVATAYRVCAAVLILAGGAGAALAVANARRARPA